MASVVVSRSCRRQDGRPFTLPRPFNWDLAHGNSHDCSWSFGDAQAREEDPTTHQYAFMSDCQPAARRPGSTCDRRVSSADALQEPVWMSVSASRSDASSVSPSGCAISSAAAQSGANPSKKSPSPRALRNVNDTGANTLSQNSYLYWPTGLPYVRSPTI